MAIGDILFYDKTGSGNLINAAISWWTHSRFSHTAIDIGGGKMVESGIDGLIERPLDLVDATIWSYAKEVRDRDPKDMAAAIAWLQGLVAKHLGYGYLDFVENANPLRNLIHTISPQHYDCSALCTDFLVHAGGVDLCGLEDDVHAVTPATLSKCLGIK